MTVFRKNFDLRRLHLVICSCFRECMEQMASSLQNSEGNNYDRYKINEYGGAERAYDADW